MPSITHFLIGGLIGYFYYLMSDKKFSKIHVFLLMLNNYWGPDLGWLAGGVGDFAHTYLGAFVFAIPLAFLGRYLSRFSPDFQHKEITDLGSYRLTYNQSYLLTAAGCLMHNHLDGLINSVGDFHILPEVGSKFESFDYSLLQFHQLWEDGALGIDTYWAILIGIIFVIGFIYVFSFLLSRAERYVAIGSILFIIPFIICAYYFGQLTTQHAEVGALIYGGMYWVVPVMLCALSVKNITFSTTEDYDKELKSALSEQSRISKFNRFLTQLILLIGGFFVLIGIAAIFLNQNVISFIVDRFDFWIPYSNHLSQFVKGLSLVLIIFGVLNIIVGKRLLQYPGENTALPLLITWWLISCWVLSLIFIGSLSIVEPVVIYVYDFFPEIVSVVGSDEFLPLITKIVIGVSIGLFILNFTCALGLLLLNPKLWKFTIIYHGLLAWTLIGLVICCYLSQNSVKELIFPKEYSE